MRSANALAQSQTASGRAAIRDVSSRGASSCCASSLAAPLANAARLATSAPVALVQQDTAKRTDASPAIAELHERAVADYARYAHRIYAQCEAHAIALRAAIDALLAAPSADTLARARTAWLAGRADYGKTEVLRYYGGPIDDPRVGVETFLNAWPLDEAYIDAVEGAPESGIINDVARYPDFDATLLPLLNERGGEANVALGWHAVEFLLWGQDRSPNGPGARSHDDYVEGRGRNAARRAKYLRTCAELLVEHHRTLRVAWEPGADNYRAAFCAAPPQRSLRNMLAGMTILSGFEMAGERLSVAYETRDQENEHSCFSDNTHVDFVADELGIAAVWRGDAVEPTGVGLRDVARALDARLAEEVDQRIDAALAALRALPVPFDQAIRAADASAERKAVHAALLALERQAQMLSGLGLALGYEIALRPGG